MLHFKVEPKRHAARPLANEQWLASTIEVPDPVAAVVADESALRLVDVALLGPELQTLPSLRLMSRAQCPKRDSVFHPERFAYRISALFLDTYTIGHTTLQPTNAPSDVRGRPPYSTDRALASLR